MLWCSWKGTSENHDGYILTDLICLNHITIHCGSSRVTWGETLVTMRDFPINLFELELYTVYGSSVGPAVIRIPPSLTQLCVLLVWSINRAQESLPWICCIVLWRPKVSKALFGQSLCFEPGVCSERSAKVTACLWVEGTPLKIRWAFEEEKAGEGLLQNKGWGVPYICHLCRHIDCQMQQSAL